MDSTPQALAELARAYLRRRYGITSGPIALHVILGPDLELESVFPVLLPSRPPDSPTGEVHANILQALAEAVAPLTGPKLAEAAGYACGGSFRAALAQLVKSGEVINLKPGYALPAQADGA